MDKLPLRDIKRFLPALLGFILGSVWVGPAWAERVGDFEIVAQPVQQESSETIQTGSKWTTQKDKSQHLAYLGDAEVGERVNIGAGAITCNYDGTNKFETIIGSNAFIGSNSSLVAPVTIGDGAYISSGSVITEDVPANALAFGRARQVNKPDYAAKIRARAEAIKAARKK